MNLSIIFFLLWFCCFDSSMLCVDLEMPFAWCRTLTINQSKLFFFSSPVHMVNEEFTQWAQKKKLTHKHRKMHKIWRKLDFFCLFRCNHSGTELNLLRIEWAIYVVLCPFFANIQILSIKHSISVCTLYKYTHLWKCKHSAVIRSVKCEI